ncbi:MAG: hypothetical protein WAT71_04895 [Ignavibacteria bacterium]
MSNQKSISLFTDSLIDYAGLFPPAKLDLKTSFNNFVFYQSNKYSSMLSKFICPVKLLPELNELNIIKTEISNPVEISLILSGGENLDDFKNSLNYELKLRSNFIRDTKINCRVNNFEYKIPDEIIINKNDKEISELFKFISIKTSGHDPDNILSFFAESNLLGNWKKNIEFTADAIEQHNETYGDTGFKLRTGGITKTAFPSSEQIAFAIGYCLKRNLEMKFTAGLHHPLRHFDSSLDTMMHGFINVFAAGIIAKRHNISEHEMIKLLEDESAENFKFSESGLNWNGYEIENEDIHFARSTFVRSYGSCSFDEPVDDLRNLKLIN